MAARKQQTGRTTRRRTTDLKPSAPSAPRTSELIVNVSNRETRIALLDDGKLMEFRVEREERVVGSIFKGIVQNVLPGMEAAFVDIGLERNTYLSIADILPEEGNDNSPASVRRSELRRRKIKDLLKPGQQVMVQVTKGPRGTKGARVSTRISLPGRYVVLLPESGGVAVSRKIDDRRERDRLKKIGEKICPPGFGLIARTECDGRTETELRSDILYLVRVWEEVTKQAKRLRAPACVHRDQTLLFRTVREVFGDQITRMVIDDPDEYEKVHLIAKVVAPAMVNKIQLYDREEPIFDFYGVEKELDRLMQHHVPLKSGGYLVIDEMEALTAIDVNTGKHIGSTALSDTILKTNLEAADEILRQLRLRDMGGIIVCDFIDMEDAGDKKKILDHFTAGLGYDRARTRVGKISSLGLVELTRKRTGESVTQEITESCPMCMGVGRIPSKETVSLWIERDMRRRMLEPGNAFLVEAHPAVIEALIGLDGENVEELEHEIRRGIYIRANFDLEYEEYEITAGTLDEFDKELMIYRRSQVMEVNVRRSAFEGSTRAVGWTDEGFFVEVINGYETIGHRAKVVLHDLRRSYGVADLIMPGTAGVNRSLV
ncbi:MAG: Rne/Rng family ribonuclease [Armatimonadetes bacterium]|nr:Rne/Rng family ribonuclease [Armatimonadota bacterium]